MAKNTMDEVAEDSKAETSNGNHFEGGSAKPGGAEKGGPGHEKAFDREPPDAEQPAKPKSTEN